MRHGERAATALERTRRPPAAVNLILQQDFIATHASSDLWFNNMSRILKAEQKWQRTGRRTPSFVKSVKISWIFYFHNKIVQIFQSGKTIKVCDLCLQLNRSTFKKIEENGEKNTSEKARATIIFSLKNEVGGLVKALKLFQVTHLSLITDPFFQNCD